MDYYNNAVDILTNPKHSRWVTDCLLLAETVLCALVIWKVPYTEIDWKAYMQQVSLFLNGTTDYYLLKGDTGPLVYPAFHVYIYSALYYLTDRGTNLFQAQILFAALYLVTIALVLACYQRVGAPPWLLATLVCSKRLHSIFLLRLFNDAWVAAFLWGMIYAFQRKWWNVGAGLFTLGLGVKMSMLLVLPAAGTIVLQGHGTSEAAFIGAFCGMVQMVASFPFVVDGEGWHYLSRAFDLGRKFLFKWTVNWRFVGQEVFESNAFAGSLLVAHVSLLLVFLRQRWIRPSSKGLGEFLHKYSRTMDHKLEREYERNVTPTFVMDTVLGCMAIGLLCARSLHYQFYAYLGWATPYLLWRSGVHPILVLANLALQEFAWLQYPSTMVSSITVVVELMVALACVWYGSAYEPEVNVEEEEPKAHSE